MNNINDMYYQNYYNVNDIANIKSEEEVQEDLVNVSEGFKRGNIFKNLYWPYAKGRYNFEPKNERQRLLLSIMENSFYAHELNLYLDNFPNDKERIKLFNMYNDIADDLTTQYNKKYEPLNLAYNELSNVPFSWVESPWPWEGV